MITDALSLVAAILPVAGCLPAILLRPGKAPTLSFPLPRRSVEIRTIASDEQSEEPRALVA